MVPVLKGTHFNYLERSQRQNNSPGYTLPRLPFKPYISEPSGSSGQYIPPAWQLHEGARKPGDLQALLDSLPSPHLLGMRTPGWRLSGNQGCF